MSVRNISLKCPGNRLIKLKTNRSRNASTGGYAEEMLSKFKLNKNVSVSLGSLTPGGRCGCLFYLPGLLEEHRCDLHMEIMSNDQEISLTDIYRPGKISRLMGS